MIVLSAFLATGCVTAEEFQRQQLRVNNLQAEVGDLKEQIRLYQMEMERLLGQTRESVPSMRREVDRMRNDLQRVVDGVETAKIDGELPPDTVLTMKHRLNHIGARLDRLEARLKLQPIPIAAIIKEDAVDQAAVTIGVGAPNIEVPADDPALQAEEDQFNEAKTLFNDKDYSGAYKKFKEFTENNPKSKFAPAAQFYTAESLYSQDKYEESILEFQKVIQDYPKSSKVPPSLLKQAYAFLAIGDQTSGKLLLRKVVRDHPKSESAKVAKEKLKSLK